jgi:hypothetical protein
MPPAWQLPAFLAYNPLSNSEVKIQNRNHKLQYNCNRVRLLWRRLGQMFRLYRFPTCTC